MGGCVRNGSMSGENADASVNSFVAVVARRQSHNDASTPISARRRAALTQSISPRASPLSSLKRDADAWFGVNGYLFFFHKFDAALRARRLSISGLKF